MRWSYRLGRFFGIDVRVHITFLLMVAWFALAQRSQGFGAVMVSALFMLVLFAFVVMHEYGHALMARRFGVRTRGITLYPIGGVALLESMPKTPRQQILVAIAGPAVNFVLAGAIALAAYALGSDVLHPNLDPDAGTGALLGVLFNANMMLGLFNLLPALPMDGGRVLRAALAMRMPPVRATRMAAKVAKVLAVLMAGYGLANEQPMLGLIALFVWFVSNAEVRAAEQQARETETQVVGTPPWAEHQPRGFSGWGAARSTHARTAGMVVEVVEGPGGPEVRVVRAR
jgi:Zn-dependent protease